MKILTTFLRLSYSIHEVVAFHHASALRYAYLASLDPHAPPEHQAIVDSGKAIIGAIDQAYPEQAHAASAH
jgi:hypothetical protein